MPTSIRVVLAVELLLVAVEHAIPGTGCVLPVGGNHFVQLGVLLCLGVAFEEFADVVRRRRRR
jgi:hypothetical protein